jgi:hypothetical protein
MTRKAALESKAIQERDVASEGAVVPSCRVAWLDTCMGTSSPELSESSSSQSSSLESGSESGFEGAPWCREGFLCESLRAGFLCESLRAGFLSSGFCDSLDFEAGFGAEVRDELVAAARMPASSLTVGSRFTCSVPCISWAIARFWAAGRLLTVGLTGFFV